MFSRKKAPFVSGGKIQNVLGPNTICHGVIKSEGNVRVEGIFDGSIETAGNVIIGASAQVLGDIAGRAVQVWGIVKGDVTARDRLEILAGGQVWGDVRAGALSIEGGGLLHGKSMVTAEGTEPLMIEPSATMIPATGTAWLLGMADKSAPASALGESGHAPPLKLMHSAVVRAAADAAMARVLWGREGKEE